MQIREETSGSAASTCTRGSAGTGDPLLVLHGAGGNRGFTRWASKWRSATRCGCRRIPDSGARVTPSGWKASTTSRASICGSWMRLGLRRPHVLGQSIGGWTAAEMAAMSPGAIDRLVLVAPAGLKPEKGEIPTSSSIAGAAPRAERARSEDDPRMGRALRQAARAGGSRDRRAQP